MKIVAKLFFVAFAIACLYACSNWLYLLYQYSQRGIKTHAQVVEVKKFGESKPSYYAMLQFEDTQHQKITIERRMRTKVGEKIAIRYLTESPKDATTESIGMMVFYATISGVMSLFVIAGLVVFTNNPISRKIFERLKNNKL